MLNSFDICGAVDLIDGRRKEVVLQASSLAEPVLVEILGQSLLSLAKILAEFHQVFDQVLDQRSTSGDPDVLFAWAAEYDPGFKDSLMIYRRHQNGGCHVE